MAIMNDVTEVLHKIRAKLYPNYLGKGEAYIARFQTEAPLSIEDICAGAKNRGGFTGRYEDLVEHVHIFSSTRHLASPLPASGPPKMLDIADL